MNKEKMVIILHILLVITVKQMHYNIAYKIKLIYYNKIITVIHVYIWQL